MITVKFKTALSLLSLLLLTIGLVYGTSYRGRVVDISNNEPIPYVNIGIPLYNIGTISNADGEFVINIDDRYIDKELEFSHISYYEVFIRVGELSHDDNVIQLEINPHELDEVIVYSINKREKTFGYKSARQRSLYYTYAIEDSLCGVIAKSDPRYKTPFMEFGIFIKNSRAVRLNKLNLDFAWSKFDRVVMRINVYEVTGDMPYMDVPDSLRHKKTFSWHPTGEYMTKVKQSNIRNILREPIYLEFGHPFRFTGTRVMDLMPYNIVARDSFLLTIEIVDADGCGTMSLFSKQKDSFIRFVSQGPWIRTKHTPCISVDVVYND